MHPIIIHQIATYRAEELRRRAEFRRAHAPARRSADRHAPSRRVRSSLAQVWALLGTFRSV